MDSHCSTAAIRDFTEMLKGMPGALFGDEAGELTHTFVPGQYVRELRCPAGVLAVSKRHKTDHPFFVMVGTCSVLTEDGPMTVSAPYHGITRAGTKRIVYTHTETVWVTVHATDSTDLAEIEAQVIDEEAD